MLHGQLWHTEEVIILPLIDEPPSPIATIWLTIKRKARLQSSRSQPRLLLLVTILFSFILSGFAWRNTLLHRHSTILTNDQQDYVSFVLGRQFALVNWQSAPMDFNLGPVYKKGQSVGGADNESKSDRVQVYTVQAGDTLSDIATRFSTDANNLAAYNHLSNADQINLGDKIRISSSAVNQAVAAKTPSVKTAVPVIDFAWPAQGTITQGASLTHMAIDIGLSEGTPIYASEDGCARPASGWNGGYGNMIILHHDNNWDTLYAHLSRVMLNPDQCVQKGQLIAFSGNTGHSTGPHLHFEIRRYGIKLNPLRYLP